MEKIRSRSACNFYAHVVARAIYTEVKEGRGSLTRWCVSRHFAPAAEYVKKKLPSMYHQFKELADVDITTDRWKSVHVSLT